jgi:hypothetical protein
LGQPSTEGPQATQLVLKSRDLWGG